MISAVDVLPVDEGLDRLGVGSVGFSEEDVRQAEAEVARVLAFSQGLPLVVVSGAENLGEVADLGKLSVTVDTEQGGTGRRDEGGMRRGGDLGNSSQESDILGVLAEFEVADQGAIGRAAEDVVLVGVDLLEEVL